jgi:hypothetical protein
MTSVPPAPLILAWAGAIPFGWGAVTTLWPDLAQQGAAFLGPRFVGPYIQLFYGAVILSFMSGVLWGFATWTEGRRAAAGYALSTLPALWAFFMTGGGPDGAAISLIAGFAGLLGLDAAFWHWGLAPPWWMKLRVPLTAFVVLCLATGPIA